MLNACACDHGSRNGCVMSLSILEASHNAIVATHRIREALIA
ncbi:hypothetical protein [Lysobacter gummosus]